MRVPLAFFGVINLSSDIYILDKARTITLVYRYIKAELSLTVTYTLRNILFSVL